MAYEIKPILAAISEIDLADFGITTTRGRTVIRLTTEQYRRIAEHIVGMRDPENHEGTVALFAKLHKACGFPKLVKVGEAYPDILAIDENGREIRIELEFESASFEREHAGQAEKCDLVVCWRDTWDAPRRNLCSNLQVSSTEGHTASRHIARYDRPTPQAYPFQSPIIPGANEIWATPRQVHW